jgi:hypothetical protein
VKGGGLGCGQIKDGGSILTKTGQCGVWSDEWIESNGIQGKYKVNKIYKTK